MAGDGMEKGSVVLFDFNAYADGEDGRKLWETTDEKTARAANIYNENKSYSPIAAIVGSGRLIPGLDRALLEASGADIVVTLEPEEAFGHWDIGKLKKFTPKELRRKLKTKPKRGEYVTVDGKPGRVRRDAGRYITIDFNDPHAGERLHYTVWVREVAGTDTRKAELILHSLLGRPIDDIFRCQEAGDGVLVITSHGDTLYDNAWHGPVKARLLADLKEYTGFLEVRLMEVVDIGDGAG